MHNSVSAPGCGPSLTNTQVITPPALREEQQRLRGELDTATAMAITPPNLRLTSGFTPPHLRGTHTGYTPPNLRPTSGFTPPNIRLTSGFTPPNLRLTSGYTPPSLRVQPMGAADVVEHQMEGTPPALRAMMVP